jgi:hypothetical protein
VHGWDIHTLEAAIRGAITETQYRGAIEVNFSLDATKIYIRPDNRLSRTLSKTFIKILLIIFLIYPFIWLFKRYNSRGGGRWEVCGGAYALKRLVPATADWQREAHEAYAVGRPSPSYRIIDTANGSAKLFGLREGEWFRKWELVIKKSVVTGLQTSEPLRDVGDGPIDPTTVLDGYAPRSALDGY